ncbi:MAG: MATE family efflux transporter [Clostridia bacterium]|nr:MATE family efflux transporter [Clostridia bacterium]
MDMKKNRPYLKPFAKYVTLNVLGMLGISCYVLADTFFISNGVGNAGLNALTHAMPVFSFIQGIALLFGVGGGIKYAVAKAAGEQKEANNAFTSSLILSTIFSIVFIVIGLTAAKPLALFLGAKDQEVIEMTSLYLKIVLIFTPAFIFQTTVACFVRNDGNPRLSMFATLVSSLFNILFDYILIYPCQLGMLGAVLATGVSPVLGLIILSFHWILKKNCVKAEKPKLTAKTAFSIMNLGLPSLVSEFSGGIVVIVFNSVIMSIAGNAGISAYGIIANIAFVILSMYTGVASGSQPLFSEAHGRNDLKAKDTLLKYSLITGGLSAIVIYVLIACLNKPITAIFNSDNIPELARLAEPGLVIYFAGSIFASFNAIFSSYFAAIEKPIPSQLITLLKGLVIIIPLVYLFSYLMDMTGVWTSYVVTEGIVLVIAISIYLVFRRRTKARMLLETTEAIDSASNENEHINNAENVDSSCEIQPEEITLS